MWTVDEVDDEDSSTSGSGDDAVKEIERISSKETRSVQVWRCIVALALLATAVAVTLVTYFVLEDEQKNNFESAVSQSRRRDV